MKRIVSLFLLLTLLISLPLLSGCNTPEDDTPINVWTLNGTTGFGMAPLIEDAKAGKTDLTYNFTVETNPVNVRDALINGSADIGAVPTNVASALYNLTEGEVVVLAINTRGVLYVVANTERVSAPATLADLSGKTVYVPAQNPAFIATALMGAAGIADVTLDSTTYAEPAALQAAVAQGLVDYAILPEPMVTVAKASAAEGVSVTSAIDITAVWDEYFEDGSLVQGCVVARRAFVEEHPDQVAKFLAAYRASLEFVVANPADAAKMIVSAGIFAKEPVAKNAIPKCNLAFIEGAEMQRVLSAFLATMPASSIGGKLPADDFYYGV